MNVTEETVLFSQTVITNGNASAFVLAVGNSSSSAIKVQTQEKEDEGDDQNDLHDKHANIVQILIVVLLFASAFLLVQCGLSKKIEWRDAANISIMMFVYGFPYILAIPSVWDIALRNTARHLLDGNVVVQNLDSIEEVASLDYLAVQSISVLDNKEDLEKNRLAVAKLQAMGVKVILATGVAEEEAREIALAVGILKKEHEKICGSVI